MSIGKSLLPFLVLPGLVYVLPMAWLMLWIERKMRARMQGRIGPGFYQPFFDFIKLMAKRPIPRSPFDTLLMIGLPVSAIGALLASLALLPVFSTSRGFIGDLVLLIGLIEVPSLCAVLAGFASRSIFGEVGATREALLSITYNLPFLTAIVALAASAKSIRLTDIVLGPSGAVRTLVVLTLLLCLPVKLRINPFSLSNAEQEIYAGPTTEFDGPRLALWELATWPRMGGTHRNNCQHCLTLSNRVMDWRYRPLYTFVTHAGHPSHNNRGGHCASQNITGN